MNANKMNELGKLTAPSEKGDLQTRIAIIYGFASTEVILTYILSVYKII